MRFIIRLFIIPFFIFFYCNLISQEINKNLQILTPLINKSWEGKLKAPDGSAEFNVIRTFELMEKGNIIKCTNTNRDLGGYGEGYFYWDDLEKKIAYFFIENGGVFSKAFVTSENKTIIIEGKMTWPSQSNPQVKQSFDFKNTFEFTEEGKLIDKWFQNAFGPWRPGHTIEFAVKGEKSAYGVLFYSGRSGNQDIFIQNPEAKEPVNLTNHPAKDNCPAASPDGKTIIFLSDRTVKEEIYKLSIETNELIQLTFSDETIEHPAFSPDGKHIIYIKDFNEKTEIWMMNAEGSEQKQLTSNQARDERPNISPDGKKILFMSNRDGNYEIYVMDLNGENQTRLTFTPYFEIFPVWSPDGTKIAYSQKVRENGMMLGGIRVMDADGRNDTEVTAKENRDENPAWSPDGRFIMFQRVTQGNFDIYYMNADGTNPVRVTNHPDWDGWASFVVK